MANRFTYRKYQGDDIYSYAVFENGRPVLTGLSRDSAKYECESRNPKQEVYATRYSTLNGRAVYKLSNKSGVVNWGEDVYGFAIGKRGAWKVFDGTWTRGSGGANRYGEEVGTAGTLGEAGTLALAAWKARKRPVPAGETSRERWVRRTRESVARYLLATFWGTADQIEGNLDITDYHTGFGYRDMRTANEIRAALSWLGEQGYAEADLAEGKKEWSLTATGREWATATTKEN